MGAVVRDASGALLLVRRGRPPQAGRWSVPGGRVEPGEDDAAAVRREVREETGLEVVVGPLLGAVRVPGPGGAVYDVRDHACTLAGGALRAGDDAAEARFVPVADLPGLDLVDGLLGHLTAWGALDP
ncbi:NUDIX domain-containing protein [Vallicoccus soli]|uniref:NUDIX domain-containing protein n=1 Tax=Vallicoccus soli TaxID=2339232 RepID=A0A3A3Z296_9ACTN|nr:NUDIX domain-containing protein [Vallicoccus soli]